VAFLCHSHQDRELVRGLIVQFAERGVELYVDWNDTAMPSSPDRVTADRIQARIRTADLFLFLATQNSTASRWCPWEIGYADAKRGRDNVLIIPTTDRSGNWHGNEYLQLYPKLDERAGEFAQYAPGSAFGTTFKRPLYG
jgi:hypothetical protein